MIKSAMIRARVDPQLKDEVDIILQELGVSTTQALTLFYQQIRLRKGIPFDVRLPANSNELTNPAQMPRPVAPFPVDANRVAMTQNVEAYRAMHNELVKRYLGQYVAICEGSLIDHDHDPVTLLQRVRDRYPDRVVLRQKVEPTPDRELRVRRPTIEVSA